MHSTMIIKTTYTVQIHPHTDLRSENVQKYQTKPQWIRTALRATISVIPNDIHSHEHNEEATCKNTWSN